MAGKVVKVYAPATVANVAVGYDHLGFAIDKPGDEVLIREGKEAGLKISKITGAKGRLPYEVEKNTAGFAALQLLRHLGELDRPLEMEIRKKMPFGSGLGSSAASAAAGVYAVDRFLKTGLHKRDLLRFAVAGEQIADGAWHADNVAPSLLGGMVLIRDNKSLDLVKLHIPKGLFAIVIYPHIQIFTKDSRRILRDHVPFDSSIQQVANAAAFVAAMFNSDLDLLERSLQDLLVEPQRAKLIPHFYKIKEIALENGAMGFSISGAGPSMFALCKNTKSLENIKVHLELFLNDKGIKHEIYTSEINHQGAILC